jgi:hypothetical protein
VLTRIAMLVNGKMASLCTQAWALIMACLCKLVSNLRVAFSQVFLSVVNLWILLVKTLLNFKASLASLITVGQSIKVGLKRAATISGQIGQQLATTAHQTLQRVKTLFKRGK